MKRYNLLNNALSQLMAISMYRPSRRAHDFKKLEAGYKTPTNGRDIHYLPAGISLMQKNIESKSREKKKLSTILFG